MKKTISRILSMMMVIMIAFTLIIIPQTYVANADTADKFPDGVNYAKSVTLSTGLYQFDLGKKYNDSKDKISLKSSNKAVASVEKKKPIVNLKKSGKATITFTVTKKNGTKKTYKTKIKVVKYQNPFKSFKIGSEECKSQFKKNNTDAEVEVPKKFKVSVKPNEGWKVKKIVHVKYIVNEAGEDEEIEFIPKTIKNNSVVKLSADDGVSFIQVQMSNKKTGVTELSEITLFNLDVEF